MLKKSKVGFVACLSILLLALGGMFVLSCATANASTISNSESSKYIDHAYVSNGTDFSYSSTIKVHYDLSFPGITLHTGDTIQIKLPDELKSSNKEFFDVIDDDGNIIGSGSTDKQFINITVTESGNKRQNVSMHLDIMTKYAGNSDGKQTINFPTNTDSGYQQSVVNIEPNSNPISKKGTILDNGTIKWTILANRNEIQMNNLKISDTVGPNQTMIPEITVSYGKWLSSSSYRREDSIEDTNYSVNFNSQGFNLKLNLSISQLVIIDYYTSIKDVSLVKDNYKFKNTATLDWRNGTSNQGPYTIVGSTSNTTSSGSGESSESSSSSSSSSSLESESSNSSELSSSSDSIEQPSFPRVESNSSINSKTNIIKDSHRNSIKPVSTTNSSKKTLPKTGVSNNTVYIEVGITILVIILSIIGLLIYRKYIA